MSKPNVFDRVRLKPTQLQAVADQRFYDACALRDVGNNARNNGAMYLAGFVVEILLKAELMRAHPWLETTRSSEKLSTRDKQIWGLLNRSHDLDEIAAFLPDAVSRIEARGGERLVSKFRSICDWTIFARYSPKLARREDAVEFVNNVSEIKKCLYA